MFKLLELKITNHSYFKKLDLNFVNNGEESNGPYVTLIIGPNGTGKSQILSAIIEIFNYLAANKIKDRVFHKFSFNYDITYLIDNQKVRVYNTEGKTKSFVNSEPIELNDLPIPMKFIASAINLTDRYPNLTKNNKLFNPNYQYLGVRSASNNAFISNHSKSIVDSLSDAISKDRKIDRLKFLFDQLELAPLLSIQYKAGYRFQQNIFDEDLFSDSLEDKIAEHFHRYLKKEKDSGRKSYRLEKYEKVLKETDRIKAAAEFLAKNKIAFIDKAKSRIRYTSNLDFTSDLSIKNFIREVIGLKTLIDLELLVYDKINLQKTENQFQFVQASSGEYHLLTSLLGIFSRIDENSIIMIDEPEISLHPNWQMKYMEVLTNIFQDYTSCHFIIASHSHFLVSDLKKSTSAILSLVFNSDENFINGQLQDSSTFGWTPENILYNIFNVTTVRNHYFEMDLRHLLKLVSDKSSDFKAIKKYIKKFESFEIVQDDPLMLIINQAKKYLQSNEV
jgi:predicted ATPase